MTSQVLRDEPGSELRLVSDDDGSERYEVKCQGMKLQTFDAFEDAESFFNRWAPEIAIEIERFDKRR